MSDEMNNPTWIYHKTEKAKIVSEGEALEFYKLGWADSPAAALEVKEISSGEGTILYKRLKGQVVEGQPRNKEVILESDLFPPDMVEEALKDGWFKTQDEAAVAPPDKPDLPKKNEASSSGAVTMESASSGAVTLETKKG